MGNYKLLILSGLLLVASFENAYAYIDPGAGSYLFQLMLAGLVGAAFAVKTYWTKIKKFFKDIFIFHKD